MLKKTKCCTALPTLTWQDCGKIVIREAEYHELCNRLHSHQHSNIEFYFKQFYHHHHHVYCIEIMNNHRTNITIYDICAMQWDQIKSRKLVKNLSQLSVLKIYSFHLQFSLKLKMQICTCPRIDINQHIYQFNLFISY